jgi:hypothetical protein
MGAALHTVAFALAGLRDVQRGRAFADVCVWAGLYVCVFAVFEREREEGLLASFSEHAYMECPFSTFFFPTSTFNPK